MSPTYVFYRGVPNLSLRWRAWFGRPGTRGYRYAYFASQPSYRQARDALGGVTGIDRVPELTIS